MRQILTNARLVSADIANRLGWVEVDGESITSIGFGTRKGDVDMQGQYVVPGFIDMHVHGAMGYSFQTEDPDECRAIIDLHRSHGTTTMLGAIGSQPLARMERAAATVAEVVREGDLDGIFFEGPFLSERRKGMHDPVNLRLPDVAEVRSLLSAAGGTARMLGFAPELPGGLDILRTLVDEHVIGAVAHTDASYREARDAFDRGAAVATHLFNGMRPIHHRDPGVITAALDDERVVCELVADGYHLNEAIVGFVFRHIGASRVALITDAMAATGLGDGEYYEGRVVVENGQAMLADKSSIAGSTLTMDRAVRRVVQCSGVSLQDAITAASATPARILGLGRTRGTLSPGARADLVAMSADLTVLRVMRAGAWVR